LLDTRTDDVRAVQPICDAFNFGPSASSNRPVRDVVEEILSYLPGTWRNLHTGPIVHEASRLHLCVDKAHHLLNWHSAFDFTAAVRDTAEWYGGYLQGIDPQRLCVSSIAAMKKYRSSTSLG
jgi:CDP-glucose 4,6-dehydratase